MNKQNKNYYTTEALMYYANYHAVKLIDFENQEYKGWFVQNTQRGEWMLLPLDDIWNIYSFKRSHIKKIYHLSNGVLIPKEFKEDYKA